MRSIGPIAILGVGIFLLVGGQSVASAEESAANSVGTLASNTWFAAALIFAGALWLWSTTGHFKRISG